MQRPLTLSIPRVINFTFLLQPHQKYYITQYEERGFSSLILKRRMIILPILTTAHIHLSSKGWESVRTESPGIRLAGGRLALWRQNGDFTDVTLARERLGAPRRTVKRRNTMSVRDFLTTGGENGHTSACKRRGRFDTTMHELVFSSLTASLPRVVNVKFPQCSLTRNIISHSMKLLKNLAFHTAFLTDEKIIILSILTTPLIRFSSKGWGNVVFELGSERVKRHILPRTMKS